MIRLYILAILEALDVGGKVHLFYFLSPGRSSMAGVVIPPGARPPSMVQFSSILRDALDDCALYVQRREERKEWYGNDKDCHFAIVHLKENCCVDFSKFREDEVLVFMLLTYPRSELFQLGKKKSEFLGQLHDYWRPDFLAWASLLWRFVGRAFNLFAQVLVANNKTPKMLPVPGGGEIDGRTVWGDAVFRQLQSVPFAGPGVSESALQSVIAEIVQLPQYPTMARLHEDRMAGYLVSFGPSGVGRAYQRLMLFRARPPSCMCGWLPGEADCRCVLDLQYDRLKEYGSAIARVVQERYESRNEFPTALWGGRELAEFLSAACDGVFSSGAYKEMYRNLDLHTSFAETEPPLPNPRTLTEGETSANYTRVQDNDYSNDVSVHGGCVIVGCKQNVKKSCHNVSCKSHCEKEGWLPCKAHAYVGFALPKRDPRTPVELETNGGVTVVRLRQG